MDDYYLILGVSPSATSDDIKSAYRKLAHVYHPDKPTGDETRFKKIGEAYRVLGNSQRRQEYDYQQSVKEQGADSVPEAASDEEQREDATATQRQGGVFMRATQVARAVFYWCTQCMVGLAIVFLSGVALVVLTFVLWVLSWLFGRGGYNFSETWEGLLVFSVGTLAWLFSTQWLQGYPYKKVRIVAGIGYLGVLVVVQGWTLWTAWSDSRSVMQEAQTQEPHNEATRMQETLRDNQARLTRAEVQKLQEALAGDKEVYPSGVVSGYYGELTHQALIRFQEKYGLPAEGVLGEMTKAKLQEVFGEDEVVSP